MWPRSYALRPEGGSVSVKRQSTTIQSSRPRRSASASAAIKGLCFISNIVTSRHCRRPSVVRIRRKPSLLRSCRVFSIMVAIKRVVDYNVRVRVKPDGSGMATDGLKMSINPFDEIAIEEALRLREAKLAREVLVVTVAGAEADQQLRTALAMGADRAIRVATTETLEP